MASCGWCFKCAFVIYFISNIITFSMMRRMKSVVVVVVVVVMSGDGGDGTS